jgi:hypothetical protein
MKPDKPTLFCGPASKLVDLIIEHYGLDDFEIGWRKFASWVRCYRNMELETAYWSRRLKAAKPEGSAS